MSRKRKGNKHRWLTVYKIFGIHTLLFIGSLAVLAVTGPVDSGSFGGNPAFGFIELFILWIYAFYLHIGFVILITLYRLLRRLFYDQPQREQLRDEKLDRLLGEVAELRQDLLQRGAILEYAQSKSESRAERLNDRPRKPNGEWDLTKDAQAEAEIHA